MDISQYVKIGDFNSDTAIITRADHQESILGPFFYLNVVHKSTNLNMFHYPVNSTAYVVGVSLESISMATSVSSQLKKVNSWLYVSELNLDDGKSLFTTYRLETLFCYHKVFMRGRTAHLEIKQKKVVLIDNKSTISDN